MNKNTVIPILSDSPHPGSASGSAHLCHLLGSGWSHWQPSRGHGPNSLSPGWMSSFVPQTPGAQEAHNSLDQELRAGQGLEGKACIERRKGNGRMEWKDPCSKIEDRVGRTHLTSDLGPSCHQCQLERERNDRKSLFYDVWRAIA